MKKGGGKKRFREKARKWVTQCAPAQRILLSFSFLHFHMFLNYKIVCHIPTRAQKEEQQL